MKCPFCEQEMILGTISGDGRSRVFWTTAEDKISLMDKIVGKGMVESVSYSLGTFKVEAQYCPHCKKMIFDTDITQ